MKKCPKCETLNGDASRICINCQAMLEEVKVDNAYTNYEVQQEKNTRIEETVKKINYWSIAIDVIIGVLIILALLAEK